MIFFGGGGNNIIASHHAWGHHIWVLRCVVWSLYAQMTPSNLAVNIIWETIAAIVTHKLEVLLWHDGKQVLIITNNEIDRKFITVVGDGFLKKKAIFRPAPLVCQKVTTWCRFFTKTPRYLDFDLTPTNLSLRFACSMVGKGWDSIFSKCLTFNGDEPQNLIAVQQLEGMIRLPFQPADLCEWRHLATFLNLLRVMLLQCN